MSQQLFDTIFDMILDSGMNREEIKKNHERLQKIEGDETLMNAFKQRFERLLKTETPKVEKKEEPKKEEVKKDDKVVKNKKKQYIPVDKVFKELKCPFDIEIADISDDKQEVVVKEDFFHDDKVFYEVIEKIGDKLSLFFDDSKKLLKPPVKVNAQLFCTYATYSNLTKGLVRVQLFKQLLPEYQIENEHQIKARYLPLLKLEITQGKLDHEASGLYLMSIDYMVFNRAKSPATSGGQYFEEYEINRNCINIKNTDDKCFYYNVCLHEFFQTNNRYNHRNNFKQIMNWKSKFNFDGVNFPTSKNDYETFSENNKQNLVVYEQIENECVEIFRSDHFEKCQYIALCLIHNADHTMRHLIYIRNIQGFLLNSKMNKRQAFCNSCLRYFTEQGLKFHNCKDKCDKVYEYPEKDCLTVKAKDYAVELPTFTRIYADFESINDEITDSYGEKRIVQNPITVSFRMVNDFCPELNTEFTYYHGRDCAERFLKRMLELNTLSRNKYYKLRDKYKYPKLTEAEKRDFESQTKCAFCEKDEKLVPDHCHLSGVYKRALCVNCNLSFNDYLTKKRKAGGLIIAFHNGKNYDNHILIQAMQKIIDEEKQFIGPLTEKETEKEQTKNKIEAIANTIDKYMTFSFRGMTFIDTYQFMNSPLSVLCETMDHKDFKYTNEYFQENSIFLRQKQAYPYAWMDNEAKFEYEGLPAIENFYNDLRKEPLEPHVYEYAKKVYEKMNCKTFFDYHLLYLKVDVLTMTDIFETFRKSQKNDPFNCVTINSLSWSMMMKTCKQNLGYVKTDWQRNFLDKCKKGGICQTGVKKHVTANNKYMKNYDKTQPSCYVINNDANGLYGSIMQDCYLPYEMINTEPEYMSFDDVMAMSDELGGFVKVNIYYPTDEKQRQYLRGYTPFAHKRETHVKDLSDEQREYYKKNKMITNNTDFFGGAKLVMDFTDKKDYVVHHKYLKYVHDMNLGFRFEATHEAGFEVLKFRASKWLSSYITQNANNRKNATNEIAKALWKLISNAIYGKMNEKIDDRKIFTLTDDVKQAMKCIEKHTFSQGYSLLNEKEQEVLFFLLNKKTKVKYDKFPHIGAAILDLSKLLMLRYWYSYLKPKYGDKVEFLYTDTDSLMFLVYCDDFYMDCYEDRNEWYDLSTVKNEEFFENCKLPGCDNKYGKSKAERKLEIETVKKECQKNKGRNGKFKLECKMCPIVKAIYLNPKVYSYKHDELIKDIIIKELKTEKNEKLDKFIEFYNVDEFGNSKKYCLTDEDYKDENRAFMIESIEKDFKEKIDKIEISKSTKKGVTKSINIETEEYVKVFETKENYNCDVTQLKSKKHEISVLAMNKTALTPYDTKVKTVGNENVQFGF